MTRFFNSWHRVVSHKPHKVKCGSVCSSVCKARKLQQKEKQNISLEHPNIMKIQFSISNSISRQIKIKEVGLNSPIGLSLRPKVVHWCIFPNKPQPVISLTQAPDRSHETENSAAKIMHINAFYICMFLLCRVCTCAEARLCVSRVSVVQSVHMCAQNHYARCVNDCSHGN